MEGWRWWRKLRPELRPEEWRSLRLKTCTPFLHSDDFQSMEVTSKSAYPQPPQVASSIPYVALALSDRAQRNIVAPCEAQAGTEDVGCEAVRTRRVRGGSEATGRAWDERWPLEVWPRGMQTDM
ncbi:hypothetical protein K466DRAFT_45050 [Polyporus arcularius HHB13444]|uniref:Uncharacterized protein n=1 Tax=Polyporus arcularius HHB13444 TaxID=1314778 RepID=A0A5C3NPM1_9APHY|nr:hypothetical protein K466DRAFT_45050 [Polyporus arcularius HHB13444]